jgi:oxaloacetate decarboxylase alpha subunit
VTPITRDGARERFGRRISEEELLLRLTMPQEQVDAMTASYRPVARSHAAARGQAPRASAARPARSPLVTLLHELARRPAITELELTHKGGDTVVWRRG